MFQNYKRVKIRKSKENDALAEKQNLIFNFTENEYYISTSPKSLRSSLSSPKSLSGLNFPKKSENGLIFPQ